MCILCRSQLKGDATVREISTSTGSQKLSYEVTAHSCFPRACIAAGLVCWRASKPSVLAYVAFIVAA